MSIRKQPAWRKKVRTPGYWVSHWQKKLRVRGSIRVPPGATDSLEGRATLMPNLSDVIAAAINTVFPAWNPDAITPSLRTAVDKTTAAVIAAIHEAGYLIIAPARECGDCKGKQAEGVVLRCEAGHEQIVSTVALDQLIPGPICVADVAGKPCWKALGMTRLRWYNPCPTCKGTGKLGDHGLEGGEYTIELSKVVGYMTNKPYNLYRLTKRQDGNQ